MRILPFALLSVTALGLAACAPGQTGIRCGTGDGGRAAIGAVTGALAADILDKNALTGAAIGAGAGALADDAGVCY
ncbi:hypothetical protein HYN69_05085 [Gemmobacter aquarius]|uniref:17 kDa surface antigen n=1 Tax=Paragemmobacter aquarius TaxID=2169400 RepID=A0A2S0UJG9_9RHOB|nr:hypothetical protein [Gemmobacter aquarius]AWB47972.1 hypothetical protein HYN69_05085 [Gemmobacter aquarius]